MALFQKDVNPIPAKPTRIGTEQTSTTKSKIPDNPEPSATAKTSESRLTVGPNIKLRGVEIEDCDTLVVEGYVEAAMNSRVIEITETGVYKGKVEIDIAIIRGRFEGEMTARERLVVHTTGDVGGQVRYGRLAIEEGGRVHGDMDEIAPAKPRSTALPKNDDTPPPKDAA